MAQVLFDGVCTLGLGHVGFTTGPGLRTEFFLMLFEKLSRRRSLPRFSECLDFNAGDCKRWKCGFNLGPVLGDQFRDRARIIAVQTQYQHRLQIGFIEPASFSRR